MDDLAQCDMPKTSIPYDRLEEIGVLTKAQTKWMKQGEKLGFHADVKIDMALHRSDNMLYNERIKQSVSVKLDYYTTID